MTLDETVKIGTLVFTGVGAIAAVVGVSGIIYALKTFKFNTWLKAQAVYMDTEFYEARTTVLSYFSVGMTNTPTFTGQTRDDAILVCQKMDELAHLKSYVGKQKIIEVWGVTMGKSWMVLEGLINEVRTQDGNPAKWRAFGCLAQKAIEKYHLNCNA